MIVTDPRQPDNPIVYANASFLKMTGYEVGEVVGRNCRFLQGPETDRDKVAAVREAVEAKRDVSVDLLNYRKDGSVFWNALYVSPVVGAAGETQFFFASQLDITDRVNAQANLARQREELEREVERRTAALEDALAAKTVLLHEVDHRVKNNLQMVASILQMQVRTTKEPVAKAALQGTLARVEAIGAVHRRLYQSKDVGLFDLGDFLRDLAIEIHAASGRDDVALGLDLDPVVLPSDRATSAALMFNEIVTNALKHGFQDGRAGSLTIVLKECEGRSVLTVRDDGLGIRGKDIGGSGFGGRMIQSVVRQLGGTAKWEDASPGTKVEVAFPSARGGQDGAQ